MMIMTPKSLCARGRCTHPGRLRSSGVVVVVLEVALASVVGRAKPWFLSYSVDALIVVALRKIYSL